MDLISVIVPIYNVEEYLDCCVRSIVAQTYPNLEIILVDDGSPDNCPSMCDEWAKKDSRIKVIHKENGGLSDARNAGMTIATGKLIGFVDSDDYIAPEMYQLLYEHMQANKSDIAACNIQIVYDDNGTSSQISTMQNICCHAEDALRFLIHGEKFRAVAWNKLYRKELLHNERYPIGRYHEDEFFTYRILSKATCLTYLETPLYYYRQRPGSIMNSVSVKHLDALDACCERLAFWAEHFPNLYTEDKLIFCVACVNSYRNANSVTTSELGEYKYRIKKLRSTISFSLTELLGYSAKQIIYALGSGISLDLFCKILDFRKKK